VEMIGYLLLGYMALMLTGCSHLDLFEMDDSGLMAPGAPYKTDYEEGAIYRLRRDVFVARGDRTEYSFYRVGSPGAPHSFAEWENDPMRSLHWQAVIAPLPKGTMVRCDKMEVYRVYTGGQYALPMVTCVNSTAAHFGLINAEMISSHILPDPKKYIPTTMIDPTYLEKVSGPTTEAK